MRNQLYRAAYAAIAIHFLRRIIRKTSCSRQRGFRGETSPEPRYTIFAIPDQNHRCLVADVYAELTNDEMNSIEERLGGVLHGMSVFARYCPEFARGCGPFVDLFTITSGKHRDMFTPAMSAEACRAIMSVIPNDSFLML